MPLTRNTAIWPRVVTWFGQKSGGLVEQPDVMPAATSASTHGENGSVAGTSPKVDPPEPPTTAWRRLAMVFALWLSVRALSETVLLPITRPLTVWFGVEK